MPGSHPVRLAGACPRCGGDLEWDSGEVAMICQRGCGYRRDRLLPDTRELVVHKGTPTTNGHGPTPEYVTLDDLATRCGIAVSGVRQRITKIGEKWTWRGDKCVVTAVVADRVAAMKRGDGASTQQQAPSVPLAPLPGVHPSETRQVRLRSGGTVTVTVAVPWLSLSKEDRDYVFGLIDELAGYEANQAGRR